MRNAAEINQVPFGVMQQKSVPQFGGLHSWISHRYCVLDRWLCGVSEHQTEHTHI